MRNPGLFQWPTDAKLVAGFLGRACLSMLVVAGLLAGLHCFLYRKITRDHEQLKVESRVQGATDRGDHIEAIGLYEAFLREYEKEGALRETHGDAALSYYRLGKMDAALAAAEEVVKDLQSEVRSRGSGHVPDIKECLNGPVVIALVAERRGGAAVDQALAQMQLPDEFIAAVRRRYVKERQVERAVRARVLQASRIVGAILARGQ